MSGIDGWRAAETRLLLRLSIPQNLVPIAEDFSYPVMVLPQSRWMLGEERVSCVYVNTLFSSRLLIYFPSCYPSLTLQTVLISSSFLFPSLIIFRSQSRWMLIDGD